MKYARFEWLTMTVGGLAIGGTIVASLGSAPIMVEEAIAQLMLLGVLFTAVHWGRNGGFFGALAATVAYTLLRAPLVMQGGLSSDVAELILIRAATFGIVGILGGEACGRVKYFLAGIESTQHIDPETRLYNERFLRRLIEANLGKHRRYGAPFSIVLCAIAPALFSELRPSRKRHIMRNIANHVRNDVRLVDDVGRLNDGRFVLLLGHTPRDGAEIASERVRLGVRDLLGALDDTVITRILAAPEDLDEIDRFISQLETAPPDDHEPEDDRVERAVAQTIERASRA